jgi:hypothetical protein
MPAAITRLRRTTTPHPDRLDVASSIDRDECAPVADRV